ncbi:MAG: GGDEF domain-containing protein [Pseudomonadota bacterium]
MLIENDPFTVVWFSPDSSGLSLIQSIFASYAWTTTPEGLRSNYSSLAMQPIVLFDLVGFKEDSIKKIKEIASLLPQITIIAVGDLTCSALTETAVENGATDFYFGPLNSALLRKRILTLLDDSSKQNAQTGKKYRDTQPVELAFMAFYDELTGLPNRKLFFSRLDDLTKANHTDGKFFSLLYIDLDGFKEINDFYTHKAGDWLLQQVAMRLRNCVKRNDTVARMGGDEFSILLVDIDDVDVVANIAQRIVFNISAPFFYNNQQLNINASVGIALFPQNASSSQELLDRADQAMYKAKQVGKGNYRFHTSDDMIFAQNMAS